MNNSSRKIDERFQGMMQKLSPVERLAMACRMFSTGRALVVAGLRSRNRGLAGLPLKKAVLRRLYGRDLTREQLHRIEVALAKPKE